MSRRYVAKNLYDGVDPVYQSILIHMVVNRLIRQGNKNLSYRILYTALDRIREKTKRDPMIVLEHAIRMVTPNVH
jgi:small subunit ribosomal protein S7